MSEAAARARWKLHRGGIVNVWQYATEEFDLSGGRAIFQGTNGSGKSRTLELLLPLCLEGDLRKIGSKGFDTVSMSRLMLDDYTGGPNRIGYAWIELQRTAGDDTEYLTTGVGIKASAHSQQISDSWRFITAGRIGTDVGLVADGVPLGPTQLRDAVGAECLYDEELFRAKISELVYGVPATRYPDLLHLQRTLRNPDIGLKVDAGQLEQILSDSLPPLDPALIDQLARSFDDLRSIRDNIASLATADGALRTFLTSYSGYALGRLLSLGQASTDAGAALAAARNEIRALVARQHDEQAKTERLQTEVKDNEARESTLYDEIDDLKNSPPYENLRDLDDRKRAVSSARQVAVSILQWVHSQRGHTNELIESVLMSQRRLSEDIAQAEDWVASLAGRMREAGLDPQLCPVVPSAPSPTTTEVSYTSHVSTDPDEAQGETLGRELPELDPSALATDLHSAGQGAENAVTVLSERGALALSLLQRARDLDEERTMVEQLQHDTAEAQEGATQAATKRDEATCDLGETARTWRDAASRWACAGPLATIDEPDEGIHPPEVALLLGDRDASRRSTEHARAWMRKLLPTLQAELSDAEHVVRGVEDKITGVDTELHSLHFGVEQQPSLPTLATADREPASGSAFYRLVEFADDLDADACAGCEAALEACGLLNAWVTVDGTVAGPTREDLHAVIADSAIDDADGPSLADALVPAIPPDSPVPETIVRQVLQRVRLSETSSSGLAVSVSGRWQAGVLSGAASKPVAQYVGAGAREASRQRRIQELTAARQQLSSELEHESTKVVENRERVEAWENHIDTYPDDRDLIAAHVTLGNANTAADVASKRAISLRNKHSTAADRYQANYGVFARDTRTAGLDAHTDSLRIAHESAKQGRADAEQLRITLTARCLGGVSTLAEILGKHQRACQELGKVEQEADGACRTYASEKTAYDERVSAIGGEPEKLEAKLDALESERTAIRRKLPQLRGDATNAEVRTAKTQTQLEDKESTVSELVQRERSATAIFSAALATDGVWPAALGEETELPPDPTDALNVLKSATHASSSEDAATKAVQKLQQALAGSHDVTTYRSDEHILTVTIAGEHGRQPVAAAAQEITTRLDEQRNLLSEEYQQIFDRFMLRDLADKLATQIGVADDLCRRMNSTLTDAQSSQGVHVQLEWQPLPELDESMRQALRLISKPFAKRAPEEDEQLRQVLTERIDAERDSYSGDYTDVLARALDYRAWHRFTVRVRDRGSDGTPRTRRMARLSSGETRLVSYFTLFAAASAFYDALSAAATWAPLRLVLLDEAFERIDEPTIARMLGLLVDLDMDWLITWPSGWGLSEKIPRMHIYDVLRPPGGSGIACTHTIWNGNGLTDEDPDER